MSLADTQPLAPARHDAVAGLRAALAEGGALFRLALPIALIALVNMGMSVTDTLMVSQMFGTGALAAVAVGSDLYSILFYFCAGIIGGVTPFYTAAVTRGDAGERRHLLRQGWWLVLLLAALALPAIWTAPAWLATFGLAPDLLAEGAGYTRAMALTLVPMLGVTLYRTVLTAAERPKVFLQVTLAMLPLNAAANYLFMAGLGPLPACGPAGAGIASLLVALLSLGLLVLIGRRADRRRAAANPPAAVWRGLGDVLRIGIPIGIATVTEVGIYLAATIYAARLGAADVAAHTLTLRTAGIAYAVPAALLQAAMVRMARAESLAADDARREAGRAVTAAAIGLGLLCGAALLCLLLGAALPLSDSFFDRSATGVAAAGIALLLLVILGGIEGIACPGLAIAGLLRGRKDTRRPMLYTLAGYWLIGAPIGIILCEGLNQGIMGIWLGLAAGTLTTAALNALRFARSRDIALTI
ncbi:MATE family multidrug resistance protein [Dongia mobilis]|uniref:MATE family multidrug resistance protein n=1 Tax=Dongia mobilis TaxID=578943 RepID=A0A4R6WZ58_9PROT|nr:MATE family efflux transporter [Dongia mobilis]TDQ83097.1 MATE family multidrug resistance protein [Dongia mobilis]